MHIAILTGWTSSERSVALRSADNMSDWIVIAGSTYEVFDFPTQIEIFLTRYKSYDLVIPLFHGTYGEDGQITAFLKTLGCTYAYSAFTTHSLCIDKYQTNLFVEKMEIKIPITHLVEKYDDHSLLSFKDFPYIIKPNHWGSSIATSKVTDAIALSEACKSITDDAILIQEYIPGREFTVGVYIDQLGFHALPIIEIKTIKKETFFDFSEKYETDGSNEVFMEWEDQLQKKLADQSEKITKLLHCSGIVRLDYRYDGVNIYFLEINTIPGFTSASLIPKMWKRANKSENEYLSIIRWNR